ncbi:MAG: protein kinase [Pseudomonadota bacterium]
MLNIRRIADRISRGEASVDELRESIIQQDSFNSDEVAEVTETLASLSQRGLIEARAKGSLLAVVAARSGLDGEEDEEERTVFTSGSGFSGGVAPDSSDADEADEATRFIVMPDSADASEFPDLSEAPDVPEHITQTMLNPGWEGADASESLSQDSQPSQPSAVSSSALGGSSKGSFSGSSSSSWADLAGYDGSSEKLEVGSVLKSRFVLEELIGVGGMGLVYKARDRLKEEAEERNPFIAIKILNDDFKRHPLSLKALQREARKSQNLAHPNIVNVFDFDRDRDNVFMTMEYLVGSPLDKAIKVRSGHPFPLEEGLNFVRQMAEALRYAHRLGVVHSDFKPSNVFLTSDGTLKVFDFGIARANKQGDKASEHTVFDAGSLGALTPAYASLEMLEGIDPEPSDDIYALGCVAYEILTTQHPYQKQRATLALARGMKAKRIEGMSRSQWNAIDTALALRRQDRTASVDEFLKQLEGRKPGSPLIYGVAAAALALGVGVLYVPQYMEQRQVDALRSELSSGEPAQVDSALTALVELGPETRGPLLLSVRDQLTQYFVVQAEAAIDVEQGLYDFPIAQELLKTALTYYPDSKRLADADASITERKYELLLELDSSFTEALEELQSAGSQSGDRLVLVLQRVGEVDPDSPLLTDRRVPQAYNSASVIALSNGDLAAARSLAEQGLQLFPENLGLIDQLDVVTQREVAVANARQIADLESELENRISGSGTLTQSQLSGLIEPLQSLLALNPESQLVAKTRAESLPLIQSAVGENTAAFDWLAARRLLDEYGVLIGATAATALRDEVTNLEDAREVRLEETMAQVRRAAQADELAGAGSSAQTGLEALIAMRAESSLVDQARALVLEGYLRRSRTYRAGQNWSAAEQAVADGLLIARADAGRARLERETQEIDRSRAEAERSVEAAKLERIAAERAQQIDQLVAQIEALSATPATTESEVRELLSVADELVALDPTSGALAVAARERMAAQIVARTQRLRNAGELGQARVSLELAGLLTPGAPSLRNELVAIDQAVQQVAQQARRAQQQQANDRLAGLLGEPQLNERWEASIRQQLDQLEELGALDAARRSRINERIAQAYLDAAEDALANSRFAETRALLDRGRSLAPALSDWETVSSELVAAQSRYAEQQAEAASVARIAGLKRTLRTQANAKAVSSARKTLDELAALVPGDAFVEQEAPQLLGAAYASLADGAAQRDEFAKALLLAEAGLDVAPDYGPLLDRMRDLQVQSNTQELETLLRQVRVGEAQRAGVLLRELRRLNPESYGATVQLLVQTSVDSLRKLAETDLERAEAGLAVARTLFSGDRTLEQLNFDAQRRRLAEQERKLASSRYVQQAVAEIEKSPLTLDRLSFAVEQVEKARQSDPGNVELSTAQAQIAESFVSLASAQQKDAQLDDALATVEMGLDFEDGNPKLIKLQKEIARQASKGKKRRRSFSSF